MNTSRLIDFIESELASVADPHDALKMAAYMKNKFPFCGVKAPLRNQIIKPIWQREQSFIKAHITDITTALWARDNRECQMIAMELMGKCKKTYDNDHLPHLEELITTKSWWDTVDFLASTIVGHILKNNKSLARATGLRYMHTDNMWLQRTALIFQLKYKDQTDEQLLYELIPMTFGSKEFFINKASGWALRQHSKFRKDSVREFIEEHRDKMSKLTVREGSKYL